MGKRSGTSSHCPSARTSATSATASRETGSSATTMLDEVHRDTQVRIWDYKSGKERKRYNPPSAVKSLDVHPEGKRIVSLHEDNVIRVWDALTGASHVDFHALTERVARVSFSPSGQQLLCLPQHPFQEFYLASAKNGKLIRTFKGPGTNVLDAAFFPSGLQVASVSAENILRVWSVATGSVLYFEAVRQGRKQPWHLARRALRGSHRPRGDHPVSLAGLRLSGSRAQEIAPDLGAERGFQTPRLSDTYDAVPAPRRPKSGCLELAPLGFLPTTVPKSFAYRLSRLTTSGTIYVVVNVIVSIHEESPAMREVKDAVLELAKQLPDECTWDEVMYRIFVRQKIDAGLEDADAGRVTPHDEVFEEFTNDAHPVDRLGTS